MMPEIDRLAERDLAMIDDDRLATGASLNITKTSEEVRLSCGGLMFFFSAKDINLHFVVEISSGVWSLDGHDHKTTYRPISMSRDG